MLSVEEFVVGGHGFGLKDSELLVPLLIRAPGIVPPGTVVAAQVGLVDLTPTLLADRLYDLETDPLERTDIAGARPAEVEQARRELAAHRARCDTWNERHPTSKGVDSLFEHRPGWLVNRDEITRKLRSLGYVE